MFYPEYDVDFTDVEVKSAGDFKTFRGAEIFHAGTFVDSKTNTALHYSTRELKKGVTNSSETGYININHNNSPLYYIGDLRNLRMDGEALKADLEIFTFTSYGCDIVKLIDKGKINELSPEIRAKEGEYLYKQDANLAQVESIDGVAIVLEPADTETRIKGDNGCR